MTTSIRPAAPCWIVRQAGPDVEIFHVGPCDAPNLDSAIERLIAGWQSIGPEIIADDRLRPIGVRVPNANAERAAIRARLILDRVAPMVVLLAVVVDRPTLTAPVKMPIPGP